MWKKGQCAPQNTRYIPGHSKHPLKQSVSFSSRGYSIYSFAQPAVLGQHWGKELWMLALRFPLFSFPFPFTSFYSKTCRIELCMVRSWICFFHVFVSFQNLFQKAALVNFGWQDQLFLLLYIHVPFKKVPCKQLQE